MRINKYIIILGLVTFVSWLAWGYLTSPTGDQVVHYIPAKKECFAVEGNIPWKYCVHVPQNEPVNGSIAYMLHGRGQDENNWNDDTFYTAQIQQYWQMKKISPPTVVTISFGPVWLLTTKNKAPQSGLLDKFVNEVIPEVEKRIGAPKTYRTVFGESMGGINTLALALLAPVGTFKKAGSLCPVIYNISPFTKLSERNELMKRTGADPKKIYGLMYLATDFFANEEDWNAFSPLSVIENRKADQVPELYLSCGLYDKYGNYEANEILAQKAFDKKMNIEWRPQYGGHCVVDVISIAEFLVKPL